jgi:predicted Zn-dependent protease
MSVPTLGRGACAAAVLSVVFTAGVPLALAADAPISSNNVVLSAEASQAALEQARELMRAKSPDRAYALLAPLEDRLAGNADYDYLLGIAAADSRHLDVAARALKRSAAARPDDGPTHLELGRTYFLLGQREDPPLLAGYLKDVVYQVEFPVHR